MFDVGDGVKQRMAELGDKPSRNSIFTKSLDGKSQSEQGFGITHDYRAVGHLNTFSMWDWEVHAYKLDIVPNNPPININLTDMRGKLPVRTGAEPYRDRNVAAIDRFVVHHTAGSVSATATSVATYQTGANAHLPFPAIAYHYIIERNARIVWCHDHKVRVWGSDGAKSDVNINDVAIHACYIGNNNPTEHQIISLHELRVYLEHQQGKALLVQGHRDNDNTSCPGDSWITWKGRI